MIDPSLDVIADHAANAAGTMVTTITLPTKIQRPRRVMPPVSQISFLSIAIGSLLTLASPADSSPGSRLTFRGPDPARCRENLDGNRLSHGRGVARRRILL